LSQEALKKALKSFGTAEREAEVYILLVKRGALKSGEIAYQLKKNKGQIYRTLSNLKKKGLVEATLEFPTRFTAVSLEKVIDSFIKSRREEVALIEKTKKDLLSDWERISKTEVILPLEKFTVIEGDKRIYRKIAEMVKEAQNSLCAILTVSDLARAEQYGVIDSAYKYSTNSNLKYRFITELTKQNLKATILLNAKLKAELNVKARNPDLELVLFPRMVIRDDKETLFFISPKKTQATKKQEACISTNCVSLVQAFSVIFEELWRNSTDVNEKIIEIETGKPTPKTKLIMDVKKAKEKYSQILRTAEEEIILMTSAKDLSEIVENILPLKELVKRKIKVKILAPATTENLQSAEKLSKYCEIRHIASGSKASIVIDRKHLFQLTKSSKDRKGLINKVSFNNAIYTTDSIYVERTRKKFEDIWNSTYISSIIKTYPKVNSHVSRQNNIITHRDRNEIPERLLSAGRKHLLLSAIFGRIIITPPSYLEMPDIRIMACNFLENSPRENVDLMRVDLWLETPEGEKFVPVAIVLDDYLPSAAVISELKWAGTPAGQNVISVKPEELQVWSEGKTLFVGWTVPIPLFGAKYKLDPACIWFEAFGNEHHTTFSERLFSGFLQGWEEDGYDAFTTFISTSWKYSGPGIHGTVGKMILIDAAPEAKLLKQMKREKIKF
jgi:sugar-specific transcriptional regulator TrmB